MNELRYFDTFAGVGGFSIGIERACHQLTDEKRGQTEPDQDLSLRIGETLQALPRSRWGARDSNQMESSLLSADTGGVRSVCVGFSEIDKYASQVLKYRYPEYECENCRLARERECNSGTSGGQETLNGERVGVPQANGDLYNNPDGTYTNGNCKCRNKNYGDITAINPADLPDFDLFCGGFPCQSFSIAGLRRGFEDTRGTLFFEIARILAHKRPRYFLLENVKGLLSHDSGKTFQTILKVLTDLGYDTQWAVLNAKDFGVPQNRERIFFAGCLGGWGGREVFSFGTSDSIAPQPDGQGDDIAHTLQTSDKHRGSYIKQLNNPTHSNNRLYDEGGG